jgi:Pup amidohydrolase
MESNFPHPEHPSSSASGTRFLNRFTLTVSANPVPVVAVLVQSIPTAAKESRVEGVALAKVCGIETEYGIVVTGAPDANPIQSSSQLVNAYISTLGRTLNNKVNWDFEDEMPGNDARGYSVGGALPPEVETHLVNAVLTNGARFYVDHAHPEYSSPECVNAEQATLYDLAGEEVMRQAMEASRNVLPEGQRIVVYKNNSDGKGNSYGTHENYLMDRQVPFSRIIVNVMPFFVTRQIFCGAGKVGSELQGTTDVEFQISQRADFFEEEVGLETTLKRPLINTRDEPHADSGKYRRLHVIIGDANMSAPATFLKLGTTSIVLAMLEDGMFDHANLTIANPVQTLRAVSQDLSLKRSVELMRGGTITALDHQWEYLRLAQEWAAKFGLESVGETVGKNVLAQWEFTLTGLEEDPERVASTVDWVAKRRLVEGFRERHQLKWSDAKLRAIDLQYHDIRPEKSLALRAGLAELFDHEQIKHASTNPPRDTRAYFRGRCLQKFPTEVAAANWDSLVFDLGTDPLRRVPMLDPLKGNADMVDSLLDRCTSASELLRLLGA